ncbi:SDR family oxidoreductase [Erwiniaceae bacterium BAC15a-03b]|uniref:SDR family oxidoreductase n=1 Tax=Winslowiella arboricola TaxID=2978220 RepID=A0A9J6PW03_9GAMM|nr:SDR family oxidoreductase [Winslowiella arboricola]MCU5772490.1 SDR family oxidoreductase [Winslowiella arboricola]MCU5779012.1 SDR family oxidoreductase [Winslowiella arboricola]
MNLHLDNAVVVISGGSGAIGSAVAERMLQEGARVALLARDNHKLQQLQQRLERWADRVLTLSADCTSPQACRAALVQVLARWDDIDVLVNCAGGAARYPAEQLDADAWLNGFHHKFLPCVTLQDAVLAHWREYPSVAAGVVARRAIVNVIGTGGKIPGPQHISGGAANAALMLATIGLAGAYGRKGVRINAVNPAMIDKQTRVGEGLLSLSALPEELHNDAHPFGRHGTPWEVANTVAFLASPLASYINGAMVSVDGGLKAVV